MDGSFWAQYYSAFWEKLIHHGNCSFFAGGISGDRAGVPGKEAAGSGKEGRMERERKNRKYEDYITAVSLQAEAVGRREPYHLTYLKKYGERNMPGRKAAGKNRESTRMENGTQGGR